MYSARLLETTTLSIDCVLQSIVGTPVECNRLLVTIDYICTRFRNRLHGVIDCVTVNVVYLILHVVTAGSFHLCTCMYDLSYVCEILLSACWLSCHAYLDLASYITFDYHYMFTFHHVITGGSGYSCMRIYLTKNQFYKK